MIEHPDEHAALQQIKSAVAAGDDAILAHHRQTVFTGMSLGLALSIMALEAQQLGSMEAVLSLLREQRNQWRSATEAEAEELEKHL